MAGRLSSLLLALTLGSGVLVAQGLTTSATKDDWEEINFEFNSSILSDGYPSLLRIAELLQRNPSYRVKVEGHTDWVGAHPFNDKLAMARANTVKSFLEKYGANPGQITVGASGKRNPKVDNNTKEGRFMNRRVTLAVTDGQGRPIGAGGAPEAIRAMESAAKMSEECCSQILRRLDKLDEILALLKDLKDENARLRKDVDDLKGRPAPAAVAAAVPTPAPAAAAPAAVAEAAAQKVLDQMSSPKFSLLGLNVGIDDTKNLTFTGRGQFFAPFKDRFAVQAQGEYMYFRTRKEAQFDLGLVGRFKSVQLGGFSSFRNVSWREWERTATLGQASFTLDYLFKYGRVGLFGTKGFMDKSVVNRVAITPTFNVWRETFVGIVDQVGGSGAVSLGRKAWFEGNFGYLRGYSGLEKPGGTLRFVFPLGSRFAFTAEGGINETLVQQDSNGRATFGILFGNFMNPRDYAAAEHPVPVDIPRVRYEVLTRTVRTGNAAPIADAGGDQIGVQAGTVTLDGSASYDPDGDEITYQWSQIAGPSVTLSSTNTARTSFTAAQGQVYAFRLLVRDTQGAQGIARASVSTREAPRVRILRFIADPVLINPGQNSTLNYLVENATSVTITGVTTTLNPASGAVQVSPTQTTTYTLTARNSVSEETAVTTVAVQIPPTRFLACSASPVTINAGESSTLSWNATNATTVEIPGVGSFGANGSTTVTPAASTTYTLIARGPGGEATCNASVQVAADPADRRPPVIVSFVANPTDIVEGESSTLTWSVTGADTVTINQGVGTVDANGGSRQVTPATTTVYTLTATNRFGSSTADATVNVAGRVQILSFTVNPSTITFPGQPVTFEWRTSNATQVFIDGGVGPRPLNGSFTNAGPVKTQTYTLTAIAPGSSATAQVTVTLTPPTSGNTTPTARILLGPQIFTSFRELTLDASPSFDGDRDPLTFQWRSVDGRGDVASPTSVRTTVRLREGFFGDFIFEVTATDNKGASSNATVRVTLLPPRPVF